jgi:hypothetical protein
MPCYDPPPPYEGNQRKNTEEAARLLCDMVKQGINAGLVPPRDLLKWFIDHRQIDIESLKYYGREDRNKSEIEAAKKDIERAQALIKDAT